MILFFKKLFTNYGRLQKRTTTDLAVQAIHDFNIQAIHRVAGTTFQKAVTDYQTRLIYHHTGKWLAPDTHDFRRAWELIAKIEELKEIEHQRDLQVLNHMIHKKRNR